MLVDTIGDVIKIKYITIDMKDWMMPVTIGLVALAAVAIGASVSQ